MIESPSCVEDCLKSHRPLRSINDYNNDEDVEAALRDSIHCIGGPKYRQPQQPSLVDWCLPNCSSDPSARQAVDRELRRLKSLKSFQVLDVEKAAAAAKPTSYGLRSRSMHGGITFHPPSADNPNAAFSVKSATTAAVTASSSEDAEPAADPGATMCALNRLVDMATRMFDATTAAISVTDMERQKILASKGLDQDITEVPRQFALGAHIVSLQQDTLVVPDLTTDDRFQHLELGGARFYASVPLVTPEGERIGAFCVLDNKRRPEGMDDNHMQLLTHLAALAMQSLCERRTRLQLEKKLQSATRVVSATVHDLLTPLTAIELALSLLHEDQDFQGKLSQHQKESVKIASNCIGVLGQMCRGMRDQHSASCKRQVNGINAVAGSVPIAAPSSLLQLPNADVGLSADSFRIMYGSGHSAVCKDELGNKDDAVDESSSSLFETKVLETPGLAVAVKDLVKSIHMAVDAIPKTVPVAISLHSSAPLRIVTDDLKVLRCALNLLEHCASIATTGSILLSIKPQYCSCGKAMLGFNCENRPESNSGEDTNPASVDRCIRDCCTVTPPASNHRASTLGTPSASTSFMFPTSSRHQDCCHRHGAFERRCLRNCSEINLYSVAMQMDAIGGDCGLDDAQSGESINPHDGKCFWFRIPLVEPRRLSGDKEVLRAASRLSATGSGSEGSETNISCVPQSSNPDLEKLTDTKPGAVQDAKDAALVLEAKPRKRRALIIEDSIVIRKVIANALSKIGFETETAVNGMEGLHHMQGSIYDVVLCDFLMPVMDGLDCVKQYREWEKTHRPFLRQHIIGMSAHASDNDVDRGLEAGMDCFKPKPLTYKGLKNIVDACEANQQQNLLSKAMDMANDNRDYVLPSYQSKMCLIAARDNDAFDLARLTESRQGWKSLIVHDGEDALHALKKRNWDAVLLDEKLPLLSGKKTVEEFRLWEKENRVNCQTSMFILISSSSNKTDVPSGTNGVLPKPVNARAFEQLLEKAEEPSLHIIMR